MQNSGDQFHGDLSAGEMCIHTTLTLCTPVFLFVAEVVEISSDEDDVHMIPTEPDEPSEEHDPNNSGSHVNDAMNQPDSEGRVLVNVGHPPDEPDIFLAPLLAANVKPHQVDMLGRKCCMLSSLCFHIRSGWVV